MNIVQFRTYLKDRTESRLEVHDVEFCRVLEDVARPHGVKIAAETCIPEGAYKAVITRSTRFQKDMILLYNTKEKTVENFGVRFTGIRVHGGTNTEHTAGCPLVGHNLDNGLLSNSASAELHSLVQSALDNGEVVNWIITKEI